MKKIYLLSLLCCLSFAAFSQALVSTIWSTGAVGSFKTGNSTVGTRTDNTIVTTGATQRGYAVFDLSGIPAGSVVNSVVIGCYTSVYGGAGAPSGWATYGIAGDLSAVTVPATLFGDMVAGTLLTNATYGIATGNFTLASTPATNTFIQNNAGGTVSICFTGGGTRSYTFAGGEPGITTSTVTVNHSPYMTVTYCPPPTAVTASATPNPLCEGDMLTLAGSASGASGGFVWSGPAGYSSVGIPSTLTVTPASAGVYTLTAVNSCITYSATATATTAPVTVNPLPAAITGATSVCTGNATVLSCSTLGGNWTSTSPSIASVGLSTGIVTGVSSGTTDITYTLLGTGCFVTSPMADNDPPTPISGPTNVCEGGSVILLTDGTAGGTWTDDGTGVASADPFTGFVTGVTAGTATITYTTGGCPAATYVITVDPLPAAITGTPEICEGTSTTLTETTPGGTWSSSDITVAIVSSGVVTGMSGGTVDILYTLGGTGCAADFPMVVDPAPAAISGPTSVCEGGGTITLTDASPFGSFSGGAPNASVTPTGTVTGITAGSADITYMLPTGCYTTSTIAVDPLPSPITGTLLFCQGTTTTLSDPDPGGTWSSGAPGIATVTTSGVVNGVSSGNANISYAFATGCSTFVTVTTNPAPVATIAAAGPTTFCAGNNVLLTASGAGGDTYQWSNSGVPIPGATNITYTASTSGAYKVEITNTFGCVTTSAATSVTAGFTAVINYGTALNFCIGGNVVLSANTGAAVGTLTYQWMKDGAAIPSGIFNSYIATASGVYTCIVNISGGSGTCADTTLPVTVAVNPLPTPTIGYTGTTLVSSGPYAVYQWYLNGVGIPGANSSSYVPLANGSYRVRVSDGIGCSGFSGPMSITGVGVPQINVGAIEIYPNPATTTLYISSPVKVRAVISSMEGKTEIEEADAKEININKLAAGLYLVTLYDESGARVLIHKLVKE